MIDKCPRCGTYCYERFGVRLTEMKASIFDAIASAPGFSSLDLAKRFYGSANRDKQAIVRQHILQINNLMLCTDIKIVGTRSYGYTIQGFNNAPPLRTDTRRSQAKTQPRA